MNFAVDFTDSERHSAIVALRRYITALEYDGNQAKTKERRTYYAELVNDAMRAHNKLYDRG